MDKPLPPNPLDDPAVDENLINELLDKDPLQLSDSEVDQIVGMLRAARERYEQTQNKVKKSSKKSPKAGTQKVTINADDLLKDLF